jgi:hypothetical protein
MPKLFQNPNRGKSGPKMWPISVIFNKLPEVHNQSPIGRKFAQSGHTACCKSSYTGTTKLNLTKFDEKELSDRRCLEVRLRTNVRTRGKIVRKKGKKMGTFFTCQCLLLAKKGGKKN